MLVLLKYKSATAKKYRKKYLKKMLLKILFKYSILIMFIDKKKSYYDFYRLVFHNSIIIYKLMSNKIFL